MKNVSRCLFSLVVVLAAAGLVSSCTTPRPVEDNQLRAGLAEIDITPPVGGRMAGYYDERFSTSVHDPLKAKALVLQQGKQKIALVFCDLVGMSLPVTTNARAQASSLYDIPVSCISIFATHSHTGPLFNDVRNTYFHEDAIKRLGHDPHQKVDYPVMLIERLVKVIGQANARLAPSDLWAGVAQQEGLPFNRRYHMKDGKVQFNPPALSPNIVRPAGPVDHDVGMLMVSHGTKELIGGLTVFAMHADTTGGTALSADYPYYIEQALRNELGRNYISMFGAGTCGDLNQRDVKKKEQARASDLGTAIGHTLLNNVKKMKMIKTPSLAALNRVPVMPLQETSLEKVAEAREKLAKLKTNGMAYEGKAELVEAMDLAAHGQVAEAGKKLLLVNSDKIGFDDKVELVKAVDLATRGKEWPMEVQVYRLDAETALVGLPAEIFVEFGLAIKKQSPFKTTLVVSLNNDRPCYIPTLKAFSEGSYETVNSRLKPGTGEKLVEIAVELLKELHPKAGMGEETEQVGK